MKLAPHLPSFLAVVLVMLAAGCSPDGFRRVKVTGVVTLQGKPLANADLRFMPLAPLGDEAIGISAADGSFQLASCRHGVAGAVPGDYAVTAKLWEFGPGAAKPDGSSGANTSPAATPIPAIYGSFQQTPLRVTISDTGGAITIDLSLPSKRQAK